MKCMNPLFPFVGNHKPWLTVLHRHTSLFLYLFVLLPFYKHTMNDISIFRLQKQKILSQPQINLNSTQKLGLTGKLLYTPPPTTTIPTNHHHKPNVINISAVPVPISTKLESGFVGSTMTITTQQQ